MYCKIFSKTKQQNFKMADQEDDEVKDKNKSRLRYVLDGYAESSTVHGLNYTLDSELPPPGEKSLNTNSLKFHISKQN